MSAEPGLCLQNRACGAEKGRNVHFKDDEVVKSNFRTATISAAVGGLKYHTTFRKTADEYAHEIKA